MENIKHEMDAGSVQCGAQGLGFKSEGFVGVGSGQASELYLQEAALFLSGC